MSFTLQLPSTIHIHPVRGGWSSVMKEFVGNDRISYPGEVVMPRGLMPVALWLGVREYGGIWKRGGGEGNFGDKEHLGTIGDNRTTALADVLTVYRCNTAAGTTMRPSWYRDRFVEWVEDLAQLSTLPNLAQHNSVLHSSWCGLAECPYPYVTDRMFALTLNVPGIQIMKEHTNLEHVYKHMLYPKRWAC